MKEELLKGLSEKQIAKIKNCKNQQEILKLAKEEGIELTDEQLEAVSGGCGSSDKEGITCPKCHLGNVSFSRYNGYTSYYCNTCQRSWIIYDK